MGGTLAPQRRARTLPPALLSKSAAVEIYANSNYYDEPIEDASTRSSEQQKEVLAQFIECDKNINSSLEQIVQRKKECLEAVDNRVEDILSKYSMDV